MLVSAKLLQMNVDSQRFHLWDGKELCRLPVSLDFACLLRGLTKERSFIEKFKKILRHSKSVKKGPLWLISAAGIKIRRADLSLVKIIKIHYEHVTIVNPGLMKSALHMHRKRC